MSSKTLQHLARHDPASLKSFCKALAMLDAIIEPEWEYRYYSYNANWAPDHEMASMRTGGADHYFILFTPQYVALKTFVRDAEPRLEEDAISAAVPVELHRDFVKEPAFGMNYASYICWWLEGQWTSFPPEVEDDFALEMLGIFDGQAETYQAFAEEYYEREFPLGAIERIYARESLNAGLVAELNPEIALEDLAEDAAEIGYAEGAAG